MTDATEEAMREAVAELVRNKPDLGTLDPDEVVLSSRVHLAADRAARGGRHASSWAAVAASIVVLVGLTAGLFFGLPHSRDQVTVAEPATPAFPVMGTTWLASEIHGAPAEVGSDGRVAWLRFEVGNTLQAHDTCNTIAGSYRLESDKLDLTDLTTTVMACAGRSGSDQQVSFRQALEAAARVQLDGADLTLFDSTGTAILEFHATGPDLAPATQVEIRLRNDSTTTLEDVRVSFPFGPRVDYGTLSPGESSDYQRPGKAYRYAVITARVTGEVVRLQPRDYVGETLLPPGRYTYVLTVGKDSLDLRLEADQ